MDRPLTGNAGSRRASELSVEAQRRAKAEIAAAQKLQASAAGMFRPIPGAKRASLGARDVRCKSADEFLLEVVGSDLHYSVELPIGAQSVSASPAGKQDGSGFESTAQFSGAIDALPGAQPPRPRTSQTQEKSTKQGIPVLGKKKIEAFAPIPGNGGTSRPSSSPALPAVELPPKPAAGTLQRSSLYSASAAALTYAVPETTCTPRLGPSTSTPSDILFIDVCDSSAKPVDKPRRTSDQENELQSRSAVYLADNRPGTKSGKRSSLHSSHSTLDRSMNLSTSSIGNEEITVGYRGLSHLRARYAARVATNDSS